MNTVYFILMVVTSLASYEVGKYGLKKAKCVVMALIKKVFGKKKTTKKKK